MQKINLSSLLPEEEEEEENTRYKRNIRFLEKPYTIHFRHKNTFNVIFGTAWWLWSRYKTRAARDKAFVSLVKKDGHIFEFLR